MLRGLVVATFSERYNASEFGVGDRVMPDAVDGETGVIGNGGGIKPPFLPLARVEIDVDDVDGWRVSGGGFFRDDDDDVDVVERLLFALFDKGVAPLRDRSKKLLAADRPYPDGESNQLSYDGESFPVPAGLREGSRGDGELAQSDEKPDGAFGEVGDVDAVLASTFEYGCSRWPYSELVETIEVRKTSSGRTMLSVWEWWWEL